MKYTIVLGEPKEDMDYYVLFHDFDFRVWFGTKSQIRSSHSFVHALKHYHLSKNHEILYQYCVDNYDSIVEEVKKFLVKELL